MNSSLYNKIIKIYLGKQSFKDLGVFTFFIVNTDFLGGILVTIKGDIGVYEVKGYLLTESRHQTHLYD